MRTTLDGRRGDVKAAGCHAQRDEQVLFDIRAIGHPRHIGDDPAEQRIAEIGIFHGGARRPGERHAGAQQCGEIRLGHGLLSITPRVVGDETGGVIEQVADADARRVAGRIAPIAHFRNMGLGQVVERKLAFIAQLEDGQGRERLRHRSDAEQAVGRDRPLLLEVLGPDRLDVDESTIGDDAIDKPGCMRIQLEIDEHAVDRGDRRMDGRHRVCTWLFRGLCRG